MTARLNVSEKTLELNVAAEILAEVRSWPGASGAVWIGLTQAQERIRGYDEALANVPMRYYFALQFKAPHAQPPNSSPYTFSINEQQNDNLLVLARLRPAAVRYVFPLINTMRALTSASPNLLDRTADYAVIRTAGSIGPGGVSRKGGGVGARGTHRVECADDGAVVVHSEPFPDSALTLRTGLQEIRESAESSDGGLLSAQQVTSWLLGLTSRELKAAQVGQIMRGFRLVGVP